jgi:hypothetical protein
VGVTILQAPVSRRYPAQHWLFVQPLRRIVVEEEDDAAAVDGADSDSENETTSRIAVPTHRILTELPAREAWFGEYFDVYFGGACSGIRCKCAPGSRRLFSLFTDLPIPIIFVSTTY